MLETHVPDRDIPHAGVQVTFPCMGLEDLDTEETGIVGSLANHQSAGFAPVILEVESEPDERVTPLPVRCAGVAPVGVVAVPSDRGSGIVVAAEHRKGRIAEIRDVVSIQQCSRYRQDTAVVDERMHQRIGQRVGDGRVSAFDALEGFQSTGAYVTELLRREQVPKEEGSRPSRSDRRRRSPWSRGYSSAYLSASRTAVASGMILQVPADIIASPAILGRSGEPGHQIARDAGKIGCVPAEPICLALFIRQARARMRIANSGEHRGQTGGVRDCVDGRPMARGRRRHPSSELPVSMRAAPQQDGNAHLQRLLDRGRKMAD